MGSLNNRRGSLLLLTLLGLFDITSAGILQRRAAPGTCISSPEDSCTTLMSLCIQEVANGTISSTQLWSSPECVTAAVCAGVGPLLDALCCSGSCQALSNEQSLDYTNIYAAIVGNCAFQPGGCPLTWTPFVNWYYNTIQATPPQDFPSSGDAVLEWWREIATWTNFCVGDRCVDGQIPYLNWNDWFHFSSTVFVTSPGTPPTDEAVTTFNDTNNDVVKFANQGLCPFDDDEDCVYDDGPPTMFKNGVLQLYTVASSFTPSKTAFRDIQASPLSGIKMNPEVRNLVKTPSCPPPVFINDGQTPVPLNLPGCPSLAAHNVTSTSSLVSSRYLNTTSRVQSRAILPRIAGDTCTGDVDIPNPLPVLTYYCDLTPDICQNMRDSDLLDISEEVQLTYDPWDGGTRRNVPCNGAVTKAMQKAGSCDRTIHDPAWWKISCDEFPFSSSLEGGVNARAVAVATREQQYQSSIQSSITHLLRLKGNGATKWGAKSGRMCHRYTVRLGEKPAGAPANAVGELDAGGAFFAGNKVTMKYITNSLVRRFGTDGTPPIPKPPYDYAPSDTAVKVPNGGTYNCAPKCGKNLVDTEAEPVVPEPTAAPKEQSGTDGTLLVRQGPSSSCSTTQRPTSTPQASQAAQNHIASAAAAAAAASAALSAATGLSPAASSAAKAAVEGAGTLGLIGAGILGGPALGSPAALAGAISGLTTGITDSQSWLSQLTDLGEDAASDIVNSITNVNSESAEAAEDLGNVVPSNTPTTPAIDPAQDPNAIPPPNIAPPAQCFGPGSRGTLAQFSDNWTVISVFDNPSYFGFNAQGQNWYLVPLCDSVYVWEDQAKPSYQIDCSSKEVGSFINNDKLPCWTIPRPGEDNVSYTLCTNSVSKLYSCLGSLGLSSSGLTKQTFTWVPA